MPAQILGNSGQRMNSKGKKVDENWKDEKIVDSFVNLIHGFILAAPMKSGQENKTLLEIRN